MSQPCRMACPASEAAEGRKASWLCSRQKRLCLMSAAQREGVPEGSAAVPLVAMLLRIRLKNGVALWLENDRDGERRAAGLPRVVEIIRRDTTQHNAVQVCCGYNGRLRTASNGAMLGPHCHASITIAIYIPHRPPDRTRVRVICVT